MPLALHQTDAGTETGRDAFSVRARLMEDSEYVQFVLVAVSGLLRSTSLDVSDSELAGALLHFGAQRCSRALASGQIPLPSRESAYEVRVESSDLSEMQQFVQDVRSNGARTVLQLDPVPNRLRTVDGASLRVKSLEVKNLLSFGQRPDGPHGGVRIAFDEQTTVLIGPNGSGKSNALQMFDFVRERLSGGGGRSLSRDMRFSGADPNSYSIVVIELMDGEGVIVEFGANYDVSGERVDQWLAVGGVRLAAANHSSWKGQVRWMSNEEVGGQYPMLEGDAESGASIFESVDLDRAHPNIHVVLSFLGNLRVYRKWWTSGSTNQRRDARFDRYLQPDLTNLSGVVRRIQAIPERRELLYSELRRILPGFELLETGRPEFDEWFFTVDGRKLHADSMSDGTRQYIAVAVLLLDPEPFGPIVMDEPEVLLHPDAVLRLGALIDQATDRQVILATHSPALLDVTAEDNPDRLRIVERADGATVVRTLSETELAVWREDYSLGDLWGRGAIGANP